MIYFKNLQLTYKDKCKNDTKQRNPVYFVGEKQNIILLTRQDDESKILLLPT